MLLEKNLPCSLPELIELARAQFKQAGVQEKADPAAIYVFVIDRLRAYLRDQTEAGKPFTTAEIDAVLSQQPAQLNDVMDRLRAVREFNALPESAQLANWADSGKALNSRTARSRSITSLSCAGC